MLDQLKTQRRQNRTFGALSTAILTILNIGEIADTSVAHNLAKALERDEPTGGAFSQMEPFHDILTSKLNSRVVPLWWIVRSRVTLSAKGPLRQAIHEQDHRLADRKRAEHDPQIAFMNLRSGRGARRSSPGRCSHGSRRSG